ncbi:MAG: aminopeptidase N [Paracoccaceae bacterium]|nr:aminopeptidase N [Paracoccaceae bacterium]
MNEINTVTYRKDYKPSPFLIKSVHLKFQLLPKSTKVTAKILFSPQKTNHDLKLDGLDLELKRVSINGSPLKLESLKFSPDGLTVPKERIPPNDFCWEAETNISPGTNTSLDGLYLSSGTYCTQCEAEGFRKITYFLDRPDIMTIYTVRIEGAEPVLLSNGNLINIGEGFAEWHDPWPKPSYLFALVAGNLISFNDQFKTKSGRVVDLKIYVKSKDIDKCSYAMDALKRSMKWDEDVYQREYDLDLFMIVAIDDFNMGAMENKGLNIFNSNYILADSITATDKDYDNIERIIAHEYFHNWTGNRITCRDWFQLCLKEGLTVFRDQQFSASMRGFPVKRIEDVLTLQGDQFREDDGPLAHPVRPNQYLEINNFYTATVYEKGAELVRMLKLVVGNTCYNEALQQYFTTFDGQACTVEDWLEIFEKTADIDLKQFSLWYSQKGRPIVEVTSSYEKGVFTMEFSQVLKLNDKQNSKPMLIPVIIGLLDQSGNEIRGSETFFISQRKQTITFDGLTSKPIASTLRDFSAPVTLIETISNDELHVLGGHDKNLFNRWNALRKLSLEAIEKSIFDGVRTSNRLLSSIEKILYSDAFSYAYKAMIVTPPNAQNVAIYLSARRKNINPLRIYEAINSFNNLLSKKCARVIAEFFNSYKPQLNFEPTSEQAGLRAFKLNLMNLFCYYDDGIAVVKNLYKTATNMTDEIGYLTLLVKHNKVEDEIDHFYDKWETNNNVIDKWFATQAVHTNPKKSLDVVANLTKHFAFEIKNPNRFRSVIGAFAANNLPGFHQEDGKGYDLVTDWLIELDAINPQTTARVCTSFDNWKIFDEGRQRKIKQNLLRLSSIPNISKNTYEIVDLILSK